MAPPGREPSVGTTAIPRLRRLAAPPLGLTRLLAVPRRPSPVPLPRPAPAARRPSPAVARPRPSPVPGRREPPVVQTAVRFAIYSFRGRVYNSTVESAPVRILLAEDDRQLRESIARGL